MAMPYRGFVTTQLIGAGRIWKAFLIFLASREKASVYLSEHYAPSSNRFSWPSDRYLSRGMRGPNAASPVGGTAGGPWTAQVTGWGVLMIVIAFTTFGYWFVYYAYLPNSAEPAILLFLLMMAGIIMAKIFVDFQILLSKWDAQVVLFGLMTFMGLVAIQIIINYVVPASIFSSVTSTTGASGTVVISRFWQMMFYFSAGVAEESFFALFLLTAFINMFKFTLGIPFSILLDSALFMMYHSAVINTVYTDQIYQATSYVIVLFVGAIVLRTMFYITRSFAVPAIGHAMLNAFVTAISLGFVTIPGLTTVSTTTSAAGAIIAPIIMAASTIGLYVWRTGGFSIRHKPIYYGGQI